MATTKPAARGRNPQKKLEKKIPTIQEVVNGTGPTPEVAATKAFRWKRKLGELGEKKGEFVLVGHDSKQLLWRKLSSAEKVWTRGKERDSPDTIYLSWIPTQRLADTFGYTGVPDSPYFPVFMAGLIQDIVKNLIDQHVVPANKRNDAMDLVAELSFDIDLFLHGADAPNPNFDSENRYKDSAPLAEEYYDVLAREESNKKDNTIDYNTLINTLAVAKACRTQKGKETVKVYDVNGKFVVHASEDLKRPITNVITEKIIGLNDPDFFTKGGLNITHISTTKGKHKFQIGIVKNPDNVQSGKFHKFAIPYGVDFNIRLDNDETKRVLIPPGHLVLHKIKDLENFRDEIFNSTGIPLQFYDIVEPVDDEDDGERDITYDTVAAFVKKNTFSENKKTGATKSKTTKPAARKTAATTASGDKSEKSGGK